MEEFGEWYDTYPKHEGRGSAARCYATARKKTDAATLLAAAKDYAASRIGQEYRYTKQPSTWLTGEHWRDERAAPAVSSATAGMDAHRERLLWLKEYAFDGRWQANESGNGVWKDHFGVGAPPHDQRTLVTEDDMGRVPNSRERRAAEMSKIAREAAKA
jgi:hypothetical protein